MKKWLQNLSSAVIASLLALTLSGKAYASEPGEQSAQTSDLPSASAAPASAETAADILFAQNDATAPAPDVHAAQDVSATEALTIAEIPGDGAPASLFAETPEETSAPALETPTAEEDSIVQSGAFVVQENAQQPADAKDLEDGGEPVQKITEKDASSDVSEKPAESKKLSTTKAGLSSGGESDAVAKLSTAQNHSEISSLEDKGGKELEEQLEESARNETGIGKPVGGGNETPAETSAPENNQIRVMDDGSYVMVNHSGTENLRSDGDISIFAAGLNRVKSISGAGTVQITGTGILLVDSLTGNLEFQTFTDIYSSDPYKNGSVAVFVRQEPDGGPYLLVNGDVTGLLDEEYKIEGVTLVLPENTSLLLFGTGAKPTVDEEENVTDVKYYHGVGHGFTVDWSEAGNEERDRIVESTGKLSIAQSAELIIRQGATVVMESLWSLKKQYSNLYPEIHVTDGGKLTVNGSIGSDGVIELDASAGSLSGSGTVQASRIVVESPVAISDSGVRLSSRALELNGAGTVENLKISNSVVYPESNEVRITGLDNTGESTVVLPRASTLEISSVEGTLHLSQREYYYSCHKEVYDSEKQPPHYDDSYAHDITGRNGIIKGSGEISFDAGIFHLQGLTEVNNVGFSGNAGGITYIYSDTGMATSLSQLHVKPADVKRADQAGINGKIPVAAVEVYEYSEVLGTTKLGEYQPVAYAGIKTVSIKAQVTLTSGTASETEQIDSLSASENEGNWVLSLDELKDVIQGNMPDGYERVMVEFLHKSEDGTLSTSFYPLNVLPDSLTVNDVCLIRVSYVKNRDTVSPGGVATQTGILYTGSGILGGSGAGSVYTEDTGHSGDGGDSTDGNNSTTAPKLTALMAYVGEAQEQNAMVWVEVAPEVDLKMVSPGETAYVLLALEGEKTLKELGGKATVSMSYVPPAEYVGKPLYVVFRNRDNSLTAIRATYSNITKYLVFIADRLGEFMIVGFDFDGVEFSPEFYEALAGLPELKKLVFTEVGVI